MRKSVAIDFDGVLARYDGWKGPEHYGAPLPGALDFVRRLLGAGYHVVIFTTRADCAQGIDRLEYWFKDHGLENALAAELEITCTKLPAQLYIEDRCYVFKGTYPAISDIENFAPWWKT
jgi:hypothetical protein